MTTFRRARTHEITIAEFVMPSHFEVPAHDHSPPHMLVMLSGSLVERHGNSEQQCDAGSIRYSPGGDRHSQIRTGAHGAHCLVLETRAFPELHHEWVARIRPFLDTLGHAASPLSAAAIFVGRNPSIVARLFRATHGVTVQRYYRRRQIDRAWLMLSNTTTSLSAISTECGFTDQSHMTRTFSRDAGITPAQLRHNVQDGIVDASHWYRAFASSDHS